MVDVGTEIMTKHGLDEVNDFEDMSRLTHASPNAKLCRVKRVRISMGKLVTESQ